MSLQEWQRLSVQEARRQVRKGWLGAEEADLTQEGLVAIWTHATGGGSLDGALLRAIARRRMLNVLLRERRRAWTWRVQKPSRNRRWRARGHLFAADGFLAFEQRDAGEAATPTLALDPTTDIEESLSYRQIVARYERQTARAAKSAGSSRQAQHQLERRLLKWCRTNARPFDPGFTDEQTAVAR